MENNQTPVEATLTPVSVVISAVYKKKIDPIEISKNTRNSNVTSFTHRFCSK